MNPQDFATQVQRQTLSHTENLRTDELLINMGPQHPSTHGVLRVIIETDGEVVRTVQPEIGYLHRCKEKHAENVDWMAVAPFVDRMDYLASMNNAMGYAVAVERLMGVEVPRRGEYIRVLASELQRIASHLMAFGTYALDLGAFTPFLYGFQDRERILDIFEMMSGARLLYNYMWIGGTYRDITPKIETEIRSFCDYFRPHIDQFHELLTYNKIFVERTKDVGVINKQTCFDYGLTGPVLRAAGFDWDLRRDEPYSIYPELNFNVPLGKGEMGTIGDCWDRYMVRMREVQESLNMVEDILEGIPEGPHRAKMGKVLKVPAGEGHSKTECPRGELGFYIISDGTKIPYRIKVKSPCFLNISTLGEICAGQMVGDLIATLGSLDIVLGEVDR